MSADRLAELLRQRALMQEHLDWLEREIAANQPSARSEPQQTTIRVASQAIPLAGAIRPAVNMARSSVEAGAKADVDALLDEYRVRPETLKQDVRKGCLLYFAGAFVVLGLIVFGLYFALRHN
jgi:hypothetical protein